MTLLLEESINAIMDFIGSLKCALLEILSGFVKFHVQWFNPFCNVINWEQNLAIYYSGVIHY